MSSCTFRTSFSGSPALTWITRFSAEACSNISCSAHSPRSGRTALILLVKLLLNPSHEFVVLLQPFHRVQYSDRKFGRSGRTSYVCTDKIFTGKWSTGIRQWISGNWIRSFGFGKCVRPMDFDNVTSRIWRSVIWPSAKKIGQLSASLCRFGQLTFRASGVIPVNNSEGITDTGWVLPFFPNFCFRCEGLEVWWDNWVVLWGGSTSVGTTGDTGDMSPVAF